MKVYVDKLPSCCEDCVCHNGVSGRCKLLHRTTFDIPPKDCPLQSLADHDKQVIEKLINIIDDKFNVLGYVEEKFEDIKKYVLDKMQELEKE